MNEIAIAEEARRIHEDIMVQERIATQSLTQIACNLKQMRDKHLYAHLGYRDFEEYCEKATKTGKRQAYNLISLVEEYKIDGLDRLSFLGSTKLLELKKLAPDDREKIIAEADELSVRELKERIKVLTDKNEQLTFELSSVSDNPVKSKYSEAEWDSLRHTAEQREKRIEELEDAALESQQIFKCQKKELDEKLAALEKELEAERNKPVEVAVAEPEAEDIEKIRAEVEAKAKAEYEEKLKSEMKKVQSIAQNQKPTSSGNKELLKYRLQNIQTEFNAAVDIIKSLPENEQKKGKEVLFSVIEQMTAIIGG